MIKFNINGQLADFKGAIKHTLHATANYHAVGLGCCRLSRNNPDACKQQDCKLRLQFPIHTKSHVCVCEIWYIVNNSCSISPITSQANSPSKDYKYQSHWPQCVSLFYWPHLYRDCLQSHTPSCVGQQMLIRFW